MDRLVRFRIHKYSSCNRNFSSFFTSPTVPPLHSPTLLKPFDPLSLTPPNLFQSHSSTSPPKPPLSLSFSPSLLPSRFLCTRTPSFQRHHPYSDDGEELMLSDAVDWEVETTDEWEEEDEKEPEIGDGGDGGGVVLQNVPWGEKVLSIARDVLSQFGDDMKLFAFKTTPHGYIYVRLDKLSNIFGCPAMEEIESYSQEYKKRLDEAGAAGSIPDNLALEVSSPGAERLLRVPDDLSRFQDMPMRVSYVEKQETNCPEKIGVFVLDCIDADSESCVWKLADVRENRDPQSKGRPLSRKQRDWRLKVPYEMSRREFGNGGSAENCLSQRFFFPLQTLNSQTGSERKTSTL